MDAQMQKDQDNRKREMIDLVQKETAWEQRKWQITLDKMKSR